jgi:hypothetical protein
MNQLDHVDPIKKRQVFREMMKRINAPTVHMAMERAAAARFSQRFLTSHNNERKTQ